MVVKFVQIIPETKVDSTHDNAKYTVYPNMHVPALNFQYICSDTCGISIYSDDPASAGCTHVADHKKHICRIEGDLVDIDSWITTNSDKVAEISSAAADTLGKVLAPERAGTDINGDPITIPEFDINNHL